MIKSRLAPLALSVVSALTVSGCNDSNSPAAATPLPTEVVVAADQSTVRFYSVSASSVAQVASVSLPGIPGTYARSDSTVTVTMPNHGIRDGLWVKLDFAAGTGGTASDGTYKVTVVDDDTFTLTDTASGTITAGTLYRTPESNLAATYAQAGTTLTVTLAGHGLADGDTVALDVTSGTAADVNAYVDNVVDADTFTVVLTSSATTSGNVTVGIGSNYSTNDVQMHPSGKWLYVASGYDCYNGSPYCWGGDTITQFSINWVNGAVTPVDIVRLGGSTNDVPVRMAFNPTGSRLVVQDDDLDGLRLFSVDSISGELTQVANSGSGTTGQHSVLFSADGSYVYHGNKVFEVTTGPDAISVLTAGSGTTATIFAGSSLLTIGTNSVINAYSLTVPTTPTLVTSLSSVITNRDMATNAAGSLLVTSGFRGLKSYTFDGTTLAAAAPATGSAELQADGSAALDTADNVMYRSVSLNSTGTLLVSAYFTSGDNINAAQGGVAPSGFLFATVGANGALARISDQSVAKYARIARFFKKP